MADRAELEVGSQNRWSRAFTVEDGAISARCRATAAGTMSSSTIRGRLMVQGLLTATLPTKLGGDLNYLARELLFEFLRPVFNGDLIECTSTAKKIEKQSGRIYAEFAISCVNQNGKEVLRASTGGVILD